MPIKPGTNRRGRTTTAALLFAGVMLLVSVAAWLPDAAAKNPHPTPTPAETPVPTDTATPEDTPTASPFAEPSPTSTPGEAGSTYYIAPTGNDSGPGTLTEPWRTIQHAADTLVAGQTGYILPGTYNEDVTLSRSGSAENPITLRALNASAVPCSSTVSCPGARSLTVTGSYWIIDHLDFSNQHDKNGVYFSASAAHDTLTNNYVHETCREAVYLDKGSSSITIDHNVIYHGQMSGIALDGDHHTITYNDISGTEDRPWRLGNGERGGLYGTCSDPFPNTCSNDADYIRFFGTNHYIGHNHLHDILPSYLAGGSSPGVVSPHSDCFQTFISAGNAPASGITIEANDCRYPMAYSGVTTSKDRINQIRNGCSGVNHIANEEDTNAAAGPIVYKNNIFANANSGIDVVSGTPSELIVNNTFDHISGRAVIFNITPVPGSEAINNIFYDGGSGWGAWQGSPSALSNLTNACYQRSGAACSTSGGGAAGTLSFIAADPLFVNNGDSTGAGADYHLQSASPIKDSGTALNLVPIDHDGAARPQGSGYSIGAFEE
jgi:Right handed beta helix region/Pel9A-like, right handed beta helix region